MNTHNLPSILIREDLLKRANEAYHNGTPIIPDSEYDQLWLAHQLDRADDPRQFPADTILDKVGAVSTAASGFRKVKHSTPMLSLDNVFEDEEDGCQSLNNWLGGIAAIDSESQIVVEPKIDGLSLRVTYNHAGKMIQAATRGSGSEGDDTTLNVIASGLVPMSIKGQTDLEVNGEVFMDFATFERLNAELLAKGEEPYANPRNAAAGALRLSDPAECAKRGLRFIAHGVVGDKFDEHSLAMLFLALNLFEVTKEFSIKADSVVESVDKLRKLVASNLGYPIDGLVFKIDDRRICDQLGTTSRAPRWAIALKFQQEKVVTKLESITVQVSRTGTLCPVGELRPVWVDGSTVRRVTLHNEDHIRRLGLLIGDEVQIIKSGTVIPQLVSSVSAAEHRNNLELFYASKYPDDAPEALKLTVDQNMAADRPPFDLIKHIGGKCPSCGGTVIRKPIAGGATIPGRWTPGPGDHCDHDDDPPMLIFDTPHGEPLPVEAVKLVKEAVAYRCMNTESCPAQLAGRIQHFCSRNALDIEGVGEEMSGALAEAMEQMDLPHPIDLLDWTVSDLMVMSWTTASGGTMTFGKSRAKKAAAALERARSLPLHRWLLALGIPSVGENTSKEISRLFRSAEHLLCLLHDDCDEHVAHAVRHRYDPAPNEFYADLQIYQISGKLGPDSARKLTDWIREDGYAMLRQLATWNVMSDNYNPIPVKVETGSILSGKSICITGTLSISRDEMKVLLEQAGAKVVDSVSAKIDFLLAGDKAGSKADKAAKLGVVVLTETEARGML